MTIPEKPTVLYIDDEEDNLVVFRSAFRRDYTVLTTTSPLEALEIIQGEEVPIIITDQRMPDVTGVEFLSRIPPEVKNIRIILTGFSDVEVIIQAINDCNIYRYLTKPWDKGELKHTIDLALERYYLQKHNVQLLDDLQKANEQLEEKVKTRTQELEKEKEKSDQLLLNVLPAEAAEELKRRGKVKPRHFNDVSISFIDIKDFTKIAEKMDPEDLIEELDYYFKVFDTIFSKHDVEKIKTIGDAYLAACGVPIPNEMHAQKVIHACLEVLEFVNTEATHRKKVGRPYFQIRIGINSGSAIAGVVGHTKFAFDLWGDDVNLAARMESCGEVGKINISENTYQLVKDQFTCTSRGKIEAKNKGEIEMYFLEV